MNILTENYKLCNGDWFENRCKNDMLQEEWDKFKERIGDYLI